MARPRKDESERKSVDLRIPLTESQKELLVQAARLKDVDTATWARPILLEAAKECLLSDDADVKQKNSRSV